MEARQLTVWEAKERASLLALETDEWREKRRTAEDPNTTADVLDLLCSAAEDFAHENLLSEYYYNEVCLVTNAVLAHPNTPPRSILSIFSEIFLDSNRAFCNNPMTPFLVLEIPDFWVRLDLDVAENLLREEGLPPVAVSVFSGSSEAVSKSARLHIATAGEIQSQYEGIKALLAYGFPQFMAKHHLPTDLGNLRVNGTSYHWWLRLYAALHLPLTGEPIPKSGHVAESDQEQWGRSPLDLLHHLAHDGNRLVRWAAQTRLADPNFVFTWHDDND